MKLFQAGAIVALVVSTLTASPCFAQISPTLADAVTDGRTANTWLRDGDNLFVQYSV